MSNIINNNSILITGGTGSFGQEFVKLLLKKYSPKKVVVYSRDELKQYEMSREFSELYIYHMCRCTHLHTLYLYTTAAASSSLLRI